jgi:hypothetical protein
LLYVISTVRQHQALKRLTLLAAVLLCTWQTVNAQHIHADGLEYACEICAAGHDDDAAVERTAGSLETPSAATFHSSSATCHRTVSEYRQGPRAPPAG